MIFKKPLSDILEDHFDLKIVFRGVVEFDILPPISVFCLHFATTDTPRLGYRLVLH